MKQGIHDANIALRWSRTQCAVILRVLAERPFRDVFELIGKLHAQANGSSAAGRGKKEYVLTRAEVCCCLQALRTHPTEDVKVLVLDLQKQLLEIGVLGNGQVR